MWDEPAGMPLPGMLCTSCQVVSNEQKIFDAGVLLSVVK